MTTDCCNHNDKRPKRGRGFQYNPFELALCAPRGDWRDLAAAQIIKCGVGSIGIAPVNRDPGFAGEDGEAGVYTLGIEDGGIRTLMYPAGSDALLPALPLLDADAVLATDARSDDLPAIIHIDGAKDFKAKNAIAYTGPRSACPVLPASTPYLAAEDLEGLAAFACDYLRKKAANTPLFGLVLAGGYSTRMGRDKATLEYHGQAQARHCHTLLSAYCAETYVSVRASQEAASALEDLPQIHDAFLDFGPMGGILSAQKAHPDAAWLVLACDLPRVDSATLDRLVRGRNPFKLATAYRAPDSGFPEPLCAIYEPKSLHRLLAFLGVGYHCPRKVLINSDTNLLELEDAQALDNANSQNEYETLRRDLAGTRGGQG